MTHNIFNSHKAYSFRATYNTDDVTIVVGNAVTLLAAVNNQA